MIKLPGEQPHRIDATVQAASPASAASSHIDWRAGIPTLTGPLATLRELRASDAPALFASVCNDEVSRFVSPPPSSVDGFARFIAWAHKQRDAGTYISFAVVPNATNSAVGVMQIRSVEPKFANAEWGMVIAAEFWGTGLFFDAARLGIDFAFDVVGVHRLEARVALCNGRAISALRKLGAVQEGLLRRAFPQNGEHIDQALWTILRDDDRNARAAVAGRRVH